MKGPNNSIGILGVFEIIERFFPHRDSALETSMATLSQGLSGSSLVNLKKKIDRPQVKGFRKFIKRCMSISKREKGFKKRALTQLEVFHEIK